MLFVETKIGLAPVTDIKSGKETQYGLKIKDLANAMINLGDSIKDKSNITNILVNAVLKNPKFIGGTNNLDSNLIKISDKQVFCKGGAEGVFLFVHIKKGIAVNGIESIALNICAGISSSGAAFVYKI